MLIAVQLSYASYVPDHSVARLIARRVSHCVQFSKGWRPPLPSNIHPTLANIIENCWCHNPQERWPAGRVAQELWRLHNDLDAQARWGCLGGCFG